MERIKVTSDQLALRLLSGGERLDSNQAEKLLNEIKGNIRREILGDDLNPSNLVLDAQAYRRLRDDIFATMDNPDRWDRDAAEDSILSDYVKWLAGGKPALDDGYEGEGS